MKKFIIFALLLPLSTGIGLLVHISARVSIYLSISLAAATGMTAIVMLWSKQDAAGRVYLKRRLSAGLWAGFAATLAYDLSRYAYVRLTGYDFDPFKAFPLFGKLLLPDGASRTSLWTAGTLYHAINGVGFAVAYVFIVRKPNAWNGIVWGYVLELFMISLYPGWLDIKVWQEFLVVSIFGHTAYGLTLGKIAKTKIGDSTMGIF
jgi:hypothetical protein